VALESLKKRPDFIRVSRGKKWVAHTLILQTFKRDEHSSPRIGYTVTKKLGNAVTRNKIKRRLREAVRQILSQNCRSGHDYVIIGRQSAIRADFPHILGDLKLAVKKVHQ